jgi:hypothetical protein
MMSEQQKERRKRSQMRFLINQKSQIIKKRTNQSARRARRQRFSHL